MSPGSIIPSTHTHVPPHAPEPASSPGITHPLGEQATIICHKHLWVAIWKSPTLRLSWNARLIPDLPHAEARGATPQDLGVLFGISLASARRIRVPEVHPTSLGSGPAWAPSMRVSVGDSGL